MFRWIWQTFFPSERAVFASAYPVHDSIERLREAMRSRSFIGLVAQGPWGTVTEDLVKVELVYGLHGKPVFKGKWRNNSGHITLNGKFTIKTYYRIFLCYAFWFQILWNFLVILSMAGEVFRNPAGFWSTDTMFFPMAGAVMFCGTTAIAHVEHMAWKKQVKTLSDFFSRTLR